MGTTTSAASSVTVNGATASRYGDATFAAPGLPLTTTYTAVASDSLGRGATNTVNVSLATGVTFQYDANGNLTNDGLRNFSYDDENQLIQVWVPGQWSSVFSYDAKMRRRIRQEFTWTGSAWLQTNEVYYVYDGNLVIQERDVNNLPTTTYTRGKDLSGRLEGAGGIGGLLSRTAQSYADAPMAGHNFYHADGNGNVTMLINSEQTVVAKYLYDAFGNVLSASGLLANANRYQFSSKEKDLNSGLVYYLYRYYDPNLQRWPNRDPLGELGFETALAVWPEQALRLLPRGETIEDLNLYRLVNNDTTDHVDTDGRGLLQDTGTALKNTWKGACTGVATVCLVGTPLQRVPTVESNAECVEPVQSDGQLFEPTLPESRGRPRRRKLAAANTINDERLACLIVETVLRYRPKLRKQHSGHIAKWPGR